LPNPLDILAGPPKAKAAAAPAEPAADDAHALKLRAVSRFRRAKTDEEAAAALEDAINACLDYGDEPAEDPLEEV